MTDRDVIHKLVLTDPEGEDFKVPVGSTLVSVGPDPAGRGPAVWFRRYAPLLGDDPAGPMVTWALAFRGTGHPFPATAVVLGTVLSGPFAFHVLDLTGAVQR